MSHASRGSGLPQWSAASGRFAGASGLSHRVAAPDPLAADRYELVVMRRAAELLPIERELERDVRGGSLL